MSFSCLLDPRSSSYRVKQIGQSRGISHHGTNSASHLRIAKGHFLFTPTACVVYGADIALQRCYLFTSRADCSFFWLSFLIIAPAALLWPSFFLSSFPLPISLSPHLPKLWLLPVLSCGFSPGRASWMLSKSSLTGLQRLQPALQRVRVLGSGTRRWKCPRLRLRKMNDG